MNFPELFSAYQSAFFGTFRSLLIGFHFVGNFEDFKALGALLELNIYFCKKIDCKNALEALPTMPWAGQIRKLALSYTDAAGMQNFLKFAHNHFSIKRALVGGNTSSLRPKGQLSAKERKAGVKESKEQNLEPRRSPLWVGPPLGSEIFGDQKRS